MSPGVDTTGPAGPGGSAELRWLLYGWKSFRLRVAVSLQSCGVDSTAGDSCARRYTDDAPADARGVNETEAGWLANSTDVGERRSQTTGRH